MSGTGALLGVPTTRLVRGSCISGMASVAGAAFLIAASCGASGSIDF